MPLYSTEEVRFVIYSHTKTKSMKCAWPIFWNIDDGWGMLSHATVYNGVDGGFPKNDLPPKSKWLQLTESPTELENSL